MITRFASTDSHRLRLMEEKWWTLKNKRENSKSPRQKSGIQLASLGVNNNRQRLKGLKFTRTILKGGH